MDKILFENVLKLSDLHPDVQQRIKARRARRCGGVQRHVQAMERRLRAERIAEISLEVGLVALS